MRRLLPKGHHGRGAARTGAALAIVLILIGLFAVFCQTLTMLVAIQHRQAYQQADQAQARRLAEGGLLRARAAIDRNPAWNGETWKPELPSGEAVTIQLSVQRDPTRALLKSDASLTTSSGRIHKSNQTLDVPRTSASEVSEGTTP